MVFSQMSHKTPSVLKVVELARLKPEKSQQVNGSTGVVIDGYQDATASTSNASFSEEFLKPEPNYDSTMFHASDSEFFQDLVQWCSTPAKEETPQSIDSKKVEERAHTNDISYTTFSPQDWEGLDINSPQPQAGYYSVSPVDPLSPNAEAAAQFDSKFFDMQETDNQAQFQEQSLDISNLPVVIGDLMSSGADAGPWPVAEPAAWPNTLDTNYTKPYTNTYDTMPFIDQEDSLDLKYVSVIPREVENNNVIVSEYVVKDTEDSKGVPNESGVPRRAALSVDVASRAPLWPSDIISTPEVLSYVEQLEKEKCSHTMKIKQPWPTPASPVVLDASPPQAAPSPASCKDSGDSDEDEKSPATKRRHDSEDSDETYTPYVEQTPRKYKRRKPNVPIKEMILALEGSQQLPKARRGRPPKRRESTVSSVCSVDDNSSNISTQETKYRELRDKNNEASKRSRMNRKLKELQMEQLAVDLEEKNKKLKVKADILEEMTKRLKDALMTAILNK